MLSLESVDFVRVTERLSGLSDEGRCMHSTTSPRHHHLSPSKCVHLTSSNGEKGIKATGPNPRMAPKLLASRSPPRAAAHKSRREERPGPGASPLPLLGGAPGRSRRSLSNEERSYPTIEMLNSKKETTPITDTGKKCFEERESVLNHPKNRKEKSSTIVTIVDGVLKHAGVDLKKLQLRDGSTAELYFGGRMAKLGYRSFPTNQA